MTLIFNASPVIILAKSGLLDEFVRLADQVFIPQTVAEEISQTKKRTIRLALGSPADHRSSLQTPPFRPFSWLGI